MRVCVHVCTRVRGVGSLQMFPSSKKNNSCRCGFGFYCPAAYPESPSRHGRTSRPSVTSVSRRAPVVGVQAQRVGGEALLRRRRRPVFWACPAGLASGSSGGAWAPPGPARTLCSRPFQPGVPHTALRECPGPPHALRPLLPPSLPAPPGQADASSVLESARCRVLWTSPFRTSPCFFCHSTYLSSAACSPLPSRVPHEAGTAPFS